MRYVILAGLLLATAVPSQAGSGDIPLVAIGLPFAPETPRPIGPTHPLYQSLEVGEIEGLPSTVGSSALNWIRAAKRSSVNAALQDSFRRMNMVAPDGKMAQGRLTVSWGGERHAVSSRWSQHDHGHPALSRGPDR